MALAILVIAGFFRRFAVASIGAMVVVGATRCRARNLGRASLAVRFVPVMPAATEDAVEQRRGERQNGDELREHD
jgi:hypothetical protein